MGIWKTCYSSHERFLANPGCREKMTFVGSVDGHGRVVLTQSGVEDVYAKIQSFKDSCDMNFILSKLNEGDISVLHRVQGFYGDFTGMPQTFTELVNVVENGKRHFESLPLEVRDLFGQDYVKYMDAVADGSLMTKLKEGGFIREEDPIKTPKKEEGTD